MVSLLCSSWGTFLWPKYLHDGLEICCNRVCDQHALETIGQAMSTFLLVGTNDGVLLCESAGNAWQVVYRALEGKTVTSVASQGALILAGTTDGVYRSDDQGQNWVEASIGLSERYV